MAIEKIAVLGAGIMGSGIAQTAAAAGLRVYWKDASRELLDKGLAAMQERLGPKKAPAIAQRITPCSVWGDLAPAEFVVEAVTENLSVKHDCFRNLQKACPKARVLASNTSTLSVTSIASVMRDPGKVIGMHFFNPVPRMKLVEVIRGEKTSPATIETTLALAATLNKTPAQSKDSPGFISNRILGPMLNEAIWCLHQGIGTKEDIDTVMKLGMNHPMGPLTLSDLIGLDTLLAVLQILHEGLGDDKFAPCPLLVDMVQQGRLGRKSGKGFYEY